MSDKATLLRQLAVMLATGPPGLSLAARLALASVSLLHVDGASITIEAATPNRITLAVTDQISAELEQLQDVLGQGPCWDAYLTGTAQTTDLPRVTMTGGRSSALRPVKAWVRGRCSGYPCNLNDKRWECCRCT